MATQAIRLGSMENVYEYDDADYSSSYESAAPISAGPPTANDHVLRRGDIQNLVWPVNAIFLSVSSTNPATLLGFGTWTQVSQGKFLMGQDPSDSDFSSAENTGGNKHHTHDVNPSSVTTDSISTTSSGYTSENTDKLIVSPDGLTSIKPGTDTAVDVASSDHIHPISSHNHGINHTHNVDVPNTPSTNNNNLSPYYTIYVWKRTA